MRRTGCYVHELDRMLTLQGQIQEFWIGAPDPENPVPRGGGGDGRGTVFIIDFFSPTTCIRPCTSCSYIFNSFAAALFFENHPPPPKDSSIINILFWFFFHGGGGGRRIYPSPANADYMGEMIAEKVSWAKPGY